MSDEWNNPTPCECGHGRWQHNFLTHGPCAVDGCECPRFKQIKQNETPWLERTRHPQGGRR